MTLDPNAPNVTLSNFSLGEKDSKVILLPVPFDATASGNSSTAYNAPKAIIQASSQMDYYCFTAVEEPWKSGIHVLTENPNVVAWNNTAKTLVKNIRAFKYNENINQVNKLCEQMNQYVCTQVSDSLNAQKIVGVLGGDHSISFGAIQAASTLFPELTVLQIDAHTDLRDSYEGFEWSHASVMYNILSKLDIEYLIQIGIRDICPAEAECMKKRPLPFYQNEEKSFLKELILTSITTKNQRCWSWGYNKTRINTLFYIYNLEEIDIISCLTLSKSKPPIWISLDIDGLDPSLCPGTGTPVPGGLSFHQLENLFYLLSQYYRIIGFDIVEVGSTDWDANVAARIVYKLIGYSLP